MNILLVYPNSMGVRKIHLGLAYISACLKENGHHVSLLDSTFGIDGKMVSDACRGADLVGVSVMTLQLDQAKWISRQIKTCRDIPILWGGNHPTVRPDTCIGYDFVDMVCIGEGEGPIVELAGRLDGGRAVSAIENLWIKDNGNIVKNPIRSLIADLDLLPYPDRGLFDSRHMRANAGSIVSGSRECPYACGYCINSHLKILYKGKGKYVRTRSAEHLIRELEIMRDRYGVRFIEFADETFTLRKKWVLEFCMEYKRRVDLPFIFQTRCDHVDYDVLKGIREAGCNSINFGVESGNEQFRNKILGRNMRNQTIFNAFRMAKSLGYTVTSFNMIGMPHETAEMIMDTIRLNKELKPDHHNVCIFYPFPGTPMGDLCEQKGWIQEQKAGLHSYYYDSILKMPQLDRISILTYQKFFPLFLISPESFKPFLDKVFRELVSLALRLKRTTRFRFVGYLIDNLYWINSALANRSLLKKLIRQIPYRLAAMFNKKNDTGHPGGPVET